ncbi:MAG: IMPACT family protein [Xanthomonadales bacterium]|jgi:uncharacterized YigZ family protein|nr:IMPACT family protein [Xanthomonadales bacterium]
MAQTLAAPQQHEAQVQKSCFLAHAAPVVNPDAALAVLATARETPATHHCWAWRIGAQYRSSDDGEPGGTAGRPILAAIDGAGLDQVIVVVTRWYGGIKLGAGGLVRAYGGVAAECLRLAARRPLRDWQPLRLVVTHADEAPLLRLCGAHEAQVREREWLADGLQLRLELPADREANFRSELRERLRGRARVLTSD